jgi:hypothetical protein
MTHNKMTQPANCVMRRVRVAFQKVPFDVIVVIVTEEEADDERVAAVGNDCFLW